MAALVEASQFQHVSQTYVPRSASFTTNDAVTRTQASALAVFGTCLQKHVQKVGGLGPFLVSVQHSKLTTEQSGGFFKSEASAICPVRNVPRSSAAPRHVEVRTEDGENVRFAE